MLQTVHVNSLLCLKNGFSLFLSLATSWGISGAVKIRYAIQYQSLNGISNLSCLEVVHILGKRSQSRPIRVC